MFGRSEGGEELYIWKFDDSRLARLVYVLATDASEAWQYVMLGCDDPYDQAPTKVPCTEWNKLVGHRVMDPRSIRLVHAAKSVLDQLGTGFIGYAERLP